MSAELPPDRGGSAAEEDDLGRPIDELRQLSVALGEPFADRVRGRIHRRLLASELIDLAWTAPLAVLLELLRAPFEVFGGRRRP